MSLSVEAVVRRYLGAFDRRDPDEIAQLVADDFVNEHVAALGEGSRGRDEYRDRLPRFLASFVDLHYEIEDVVAAGDRAVVTYVLTARWQGTTPVRLRGAQRIVVRDDRVAVRTDYWDGDTFRQQIGSR